MKKCEQLEQKAKSEIEEYRKSGKVSRLLPETENCDLFNESDALDTAQSNDELVCFNFIFIGFLLRLRDNSGFALATTQ